MNYLIAIIKQVINGKSLIRPHKDKLTNYLIFFRFMNFRYFPVIFWRTAVAQIGLTFIFQVHHSFLSINASPAATPNCHRSRFAPFVRQSSIQIPIDIAQLTAAWSHRNPIRGVAIFRYTIKMVELLTRAPCGSKAGQIRRGGRRPRIRGQG